MTHITLLIYSKKIYEWLNDTRQNILKQGYDPRKSYILLYVVGLKITYNIMAV